MAHKLAIVDNVGIKAGMDKYSEGLARGLVADGHQVMLVSNFTGNQEGIDYKPWFKSERGGLVSDLKNWIVPWRKAKKACVREEIRHVIIHLFSFGMKDRLAVDTLKRGGLKVHAIVHDPEHLGRGEGPLKFTKQILDSCHRIYVHNQVSASFLPEAIASKCSILPHGNYHDTPSGLSKSAARTQLGWTDGRPRVLFFGQIKQSKGLEVLIRAMGSLAGDAELVIAGRPWQEEASKYTNLVDKMGIKAECHLRFISNEERDVFLKAADLIVMPYRKIFQSGVLQMAFSYRLPVICSDLQAFQELDPGQELMKRFIPNDSDSLARLIQEVLAEPVEMQSRAERAYRYAETECSWTAIAKCIIID